MAELPHFKFPFQRGADGKVEVVEQDTPEHVESCENVILHCPAGFRSERPEFGIPWPDYRTAIDPGQVEQAVRQFEPRGRTSATALTTRAQVAMGEAEIEVDVEA